MKTMTQSILLSGVSLETLVAIFAASLCVAERARAQFAPAPAALEAAARRRPDRDYAPVRSRGVSRAQLRIVRAKCR
jgi:hypothetical protein